MTTTGPSGPVSIKGTTATLSILKSIENLDSFMSAASSKELNSKFITMIKEFQETDGKKGSTTTSVTMNKTQRGFSLSQILAQSLQNGDKQMLETALCVSSAQHAKVLQVSLMRLPASTVLPLLDAITQRLTMKPRRAMHLMPWLKNLLLCHAAYLSTVPAAAKMLAPLQQSIEERMAHLNPMQKLAGRLELIVKQADLREMVKIQSTEEVSEEPLAVYDESEPETESENDLEYDDEDMSELEEGNMEMSADETEDQDMNDMEGEDDEDDDDEEESFDEDEDDEDYE